VLEAPFTSVLARAQEIFAMFPIRGWLKDTFESQAIIHNVRAPLCIIHGDTDMVIPIAHGKALFNAANSPKQFFEIPGASHLDLMQHGAYDKVAGWLKKPNAN